jgi:hypothetical protein
VLRDGRDTIHQRHVHRLVDAPSAKDVEALGGVEEVVTTLEGSWYPGMVARAFFQ